MGGIGSGGARKNAGRKPDEEQPKAKISISMPVCLLSKLRDDADHRQISTSQLITELLTKGLE